MDIARVLDEILHLCCWEESGPQASGEEESSLLSLCNHFPGQCCIHLQAHTHMVTSAQISCGFLQMKLFRRHTTLLAALVFVCVDQIQRNALLLLSVSVLGPLMIATQLLLQQQLSSGQGVVHKQLS